MGTTSKNFWLDVLIKWGSVLPIQKVRGPDPLVLPKIMPTSTVFVKRVRAPLLKSANYSVGLYGNAKNVPAVTELSVSNTLLSKSRVEHERLRRHPLWFLSGFKKSRSRDSLSFSLGGTTPKMPLLIGGLDLHVIRRSSIGPTWVLGVVQPIEQRGESLLRPSLKRDQNYSSRMLTVASCWKWI